MHSTEGTSADHLKPLHNDAIIWIPLWIQQQLAPTQHEVHVLRAPILVVKA